MRIWDINPGYLNRQSLLGEHRELHGIVSIYKNNKKGYSMHPETLRWKGMGWALMMRHKMLAAEMTVRGYSDRSPIESSEEMGRWPEIYIDVPYVQIQILKEKYHNKKQGRIPLPENPQQFWSHHKYSVMARDVNKYRQFGSTVSMMKPGTEFSGLANEITQLLRNPPSEGGMRNALQHMWGHVSDCLFDNPALMTNRELLKFIQSATYKKPEPYLMSSTALSELSVWI